MLTPPEDIARIKRRYKREESGIVNACMRWLWVHGCYVWRQNVGAFKINERFVRYGVAGCADIIGITKHGRMICVECKSSKGKLTPHQERFRDYILDQRGIYIVARSVDDLELHKNIVMAVQVPPAYARGAIIDSVTAKPSQRRKVQS